MFLEYLLTLQRKVLWPSAGSRRVGKGGGGVEERFWGIGYPFASAQENHKST